MLQLYATLINAAGRLEGFVQGSRIPNREKGRAFLQAMAGEKASLSSLTLEAQGKEGFAVILVGAELLRNSAVQLEVRERADEPAPSPSA